MVGIGKLSYVKIGFIQKNLWTHAISVKIVFNYYSYVKGTKKFKILGFALHPYSTSENYSQDTLKENIGYGPLFLNSWKSNSCRNKNLYVAAHHSKS